MRSNIGNRLGVNAVNYYHVLKIKYFYRSWFTLPLSLHFFSIGIPTICIKPSSLERSITTWSLDLGNGGLQIVKNYWESYNWDPDHKYL